MEFVFNYTKAVFGFAVEVRMDFFHCEADSEVTRILLAKTTSVFHLYQWPMGASFT